MNSVNPRRIISQVQISQLLGKAASVGTAINGFARSQICPVKPEVFQEGDFLTATSIAPISNNGGNTK
jgi:hypothetical protein